MSTFNDVEEFLTQFDEDFQDAFLSVLAYVRSLPPTPAAVSFREMMARQTWEPDPALPPLRSEDVQDLFAKLFFSGSPLTDQD